MSTQDMLAASRQAVVVPDDSDETEDDLDEVIRMADKRGIAVPNQLSVAGCDDVALAQLIYPALTTINQPLASMTGTAVTSLIDSIRVKQPPKGADIVPAEIRVRESTAPPRS